MEAILKNKYIKLPKNFDFTKIKDSLTGTGRRFCAAVFGDSVLRGVIFDEKAGGYRMHRGRFSGVQERFHLDIKNNSRFGFTVERGSELIRETVTRENHPEFVFLEYGSNDCNFDWAKIAEEPDSEHDPVTPAEKFLKIYSELIDYVYECDSMPVVVLPTPIDSEKFLTWICRKGLSRENILHWLGSTEMIYRWQEYYSGLCERLAREKGCLLIDLRTPFLVRHDYDKLLCADGMHPTEKGHELIDATFSRFLEGLGTSS